MSDYSTAVTNFEEHGTARETYDDERGLMTAEVTLRCAYTSRHTLAGDICGHLRPWPKGTAGLVPLARGASIVMVPSQGGTVTAGGQVDTFDALVTVHYTTKNQEVVTESWEPTCEFVSLPYQIFRWGSGSGRFLREDEAPGIPFRGINFVRNVLFVSPPLSTDLEDLINTVNSDSWFSTYMNRFFDVETLLYNGSTTNRKLTSIGDVRYDLTQKFSYKPSGWNTFFNAPDGVFEQIFLAGDTSPFKPFTPVSFTNILGGLGPI